MASINHQDVATDPATDYLVLNTTAAKVDNVVIWNDTAPTASVFSFLARHDVQALMEMEPI